MVAVIDTCASRGTFKAEEFSTIGRLREIIIAESQAQAQIRQKLHNKNRKSRWWCDRR